MPSKRKPKPASSSGRNKPPKKTDKAEESDSQKIPKVRSEVDASVAAQTLSAKNMLVSADQQLGADQVAQILADCIPRSGGNNNEIVLSKTLQSYGFHFQNQVDTLTSFIIGDTDFGVRKYGFRLSGDALNFAAPTTTLSDLADAIQDKATPTQ
jgi:hypothetical protein